MALVNQVHHDLKRHEGCRLKPYQDTEGVWTNGYGHTKGITKNSPVITQDQAEEWLREDIQDALADAKRLISNYNDLSLVRKSVVVNMAFNLGYHRFKKFKNTILYIESEQWSSAAMGMLNSLWARQVGQRATELAARMSSNTIPPHRLYKGN